MKTIKRETVPIALSLMLVGVLFLLRNTGVLPSPAWEVAWPLVLIVLGSALFRKRRTGDREAGAREDCCGRCVHGEE